MSRLRLWTLLLTLDLLCTGSAWACQLCVMEMSYNAMRFTGIWMVLIPLWTLVTWCAYPLGWAMDVRVNPWGAVKSGVALTALLPIVGLFLGGTFLMTFIWVGLVLRRFFDSRFRIPAFRLINSAFLLIALLAIPLGPMILPIYEGENFARARVGRTRALMQEQIPSALPGLEVGEVAPLEGIAAYDDSAIPAPRTAQGVLCWSCGPLKIWPPVEETEVWAETDFNLRAEPWVSRVYNSTNGTHSAGVIFRFVPESELPEGEW